MTDTRFPVVLLWHMHQPEYRVDGRYILPWTAAHALKDYSDMAAHLEAVPEARAVVNFVPGLLEQLADYTGRFAAHRRHGSAIGDPMLDALDTLPAPGPARAAVASMALRTDARHQSDALPAYRARVAELGQDTDLANLDDATLGDLLVGWWLAWTGVSVFASEPDAEVLRAKGHGYDADDRRRLLAVIARVVSGLLPRYRGLADSGRIELSQSPRHHPLMPLLADLASAHDTAPGVPLPASGYPDGAERVDWHLQRGNQIFSAQFGDRTSGCWPPEAAVSEATLSAIRRAGRQWVASSQGVLAASVDPADPSQANPHRIFRHDNGLCCFFRDDGLSDLIGFAYKDWQADHAVGDLLGHCERIAHTAGNQLILLALDGENAWAHYPDNGSTFLQRLYGALAEHPTLRLATLGELASGQPATPLPRLRAGSWVHAQLLTWVGDTEKNLAWDLLIAARRHYDDARADGRAGEDAERLLGICEASDWLWWPGSVNPGVAVEDFDRLFRDHLAALYRSLGESPPPQLAQSFAHGLSKYVAAGGVMRPSSDSPPWTERSAGVLLPLSALPGGVLDAQAERFADFAADAGFRVWQFLPISPADGFGNPFQPSSAFAGDCRLLPTDKADDDADPDDTDFARFCDAQADWLDDWALFTALRVAHDLLPWFEWPAPLRHRELDALRAARSRLKPAITAEKHAQFRFYRRWQSFKRYANDRGLLLFGDVPLFVAHDSADVWAHRDLFEVDAEGRIEATVGVPPDAFSDTGQRWGYPPYRWQLMAERNFGWWKRRFEVQAARFDLVRLDHFRGFAAWWRIPAEAHTAIEGEWITGPGRAAIDALEPVLGGARLAAEDLGTITDDVVELRHALGIPGMRVLQFAFDGDPRNPHLPQNHGADCICYTGTHDNDTTAGWWQTLSEAERECARRALHTGTPQIPADVVRMAWASPAPLSIVPMQDFLGLGSDARTNRPGLAEGNWHWRMPEAAATPALAARLRAELQAHGRLPVGGAARD